MQTGQILHFPAGTYDQQIKKPLGNFELSMMKRLWRTAKAYQRMDNDYWKSSVDEIYMDEDIKLLTEIGVQIGAM